MLDRILGAVLRSNVYGFVVWLFVATFQVLGFVPHVEPFKTWIACVLGCLFFEFAVYYFVVAISQSVNIKIK